MDQALIISYRFIFPDNREALIEVKIDKQNMESFPDDSAPPPDWCKLDLHQCPNCPLPTGLQTYCPLATRLVRLPCYPNLSKPGCK